MSGLNNIQNISSLSAALDAQKQILYLVHKDSVNEIQLNNNNINNYTHNITINSVSSYSSTRSVILNGSLFIVGGYGNNSILKWNPQSKTFTKFSDMYNKININSFAMICNKKHNSVLLFGGIDWDSQMCVDYIL
eukprot:542573_1